MKERREEWEGVEGESKVLGEKEEEIHVVSLTHIAVVIRQYCTLSVHCLAALLHLSL